MYVVVVQSPRCVQLFATPRTIAWQASLSLTFSWSLPNFISIASVMPSGRLILWWPLLLLPSIFPSMRDWCICSVQFTSVAQSCPMLCEPMNRSMPGLPVPSPTPRVHSDSHPSSQWCHLAISSSIVPFFSCPQSLPASESFPISQLFTWSGQSTGVSALA